MRGKPLRQRLSIERVLAKLRQVALPPVEFTLLVRRQLVVELSIVSGNTELLDQTEHGEQFRVIKQNFGEDFVVK